MQRSGYDQWKASDVARLLALVESERRYYQEIFAALPVPLVLVDASLSVVMANREFRRRFDLLASDINRIRLKDLVRVDPAETPIEEFLGGSQSRTSIGAVAVTPQGEVEVRLVLQRHRGWEESSGDEMLVAIEDPARAESTGAGARGRGALAESPLPAWLLDLSSGHYRWVNEYARALPVDGASWGSLASRAGFVHSALRDEWFRFYRESGVPDDQLKQIDYAVTDGAGVLVWRRDLARFLPDGLVSGVTLDVTLERRALAQKLESRKLEGIERLSGRIAHVANNLLMIVGGYAEEIIESLPEGDARRSDLQEILKASARLTSLTGELNRLVRPSKYESQAVVLRDWMDETTSRLAGLLPGSTVRAGVSAAPVILRTNPTVLTGFILDVVRGIAPSLPAGATVVLNGAGVGEATAAVWLRLEDCELPRHLRERILEPFAGPKEGSDPPLGAVAWIRPWLDLGGSFWLETEPAEAVLLVLTCPAAEQPARRGPKLLVVEDEESIRNLVVRALVREGFEVQPASGAEEALERIAAAAEPFEGLITDYNMPGMSGLQLAERARAILPGLKVVLISGATEDAAADERLRTASAEGMAFLQKPFGPSVLLEQVRKMLD